MIDPDAAAVVRLYRQCSGGLGGIEWPDGGALFDQPVKLVEGFGVAGAVLEQFKKGNG